MSKLYLGSIDLNKINKEDIITTDKNGQKFSNGAKYLNVAIWINDEADQYGNHLAVKAGKKDANYYIGNAKEWKTEANEPFETTTDINTDSQDDLPF